MNNERKLQELGGRLVDREIYYCVSSMMYSVGQNLEEACKIFDEDYDEALGLFVQDDWETPATEFICTDADKEQLEEIAEEYNDWQELLESVGYPEV
jgi:hypothetical protein